MPTGRLCGVYTDNTDGVTAVTVSGHRQDGFYFFLYLSFMLIICKVKFHTRMLPKDDSSLVTNLCLKFFHEKVPLLLISQCEICNFGEGTGSANETTFCLYFLLRSSEVLHVYT